MADSPPRLFLFSYNSPLFFMCDSRRTGLDPARRLPFFFVFFCVLARVYIFLTGIASCFFCFFDCRSVNWFW